VSRTVTVALCDRSGQVMGALAPFEVTSPWWPDVAPVVESVRARWALDVVVLRIVAHEDRWPAAGGAVTYLAETTGPLPAPLKLEPCPIDPGDDERRAPWARPGGVRTLVEWADTELERRGRERTGPARQDRTWNLSCLVELPTAEGPVWLKAVPPFLGHEAVVLELLAGDGVSVTRVIAAGHDVALLEGVPGEDLYAAGPAQLRRMVDAIVGLQARWADRTEDLVRAGLPDRRGDSLVHALTELAADARLRGALSADERTALDTIVAGLPRRLAAIEACGVPWTLVHGDFHPGNWRGRLGAPGPTPMTLIDWGDACVGHPLIDQVNFQSFVGERAAMTATRWEQAWRAAAPGSEPARAAALVAPVACLERAMVFRLFLDGIETTEQAYHRHDPEDWVRRALSATKAANASAG
jgi:Ser/Thr protein kinase RdoA (MazF antagonist)